MEYFMIKSMTGFARIDRLSDLGPISLELKSVNSRYLDLNFKMHEALKPYEFDYRKLISEKLSRGKVECAFRWSRPVSDKYQINETLLQALLVKSEQISGEHGIAKFDLGDFLQLPGAFIEVDEDYQALKAISMELLSKGLDELIAQRQSEGTHLQQLITARLEQITVLLVDVRENYQASIDNIKAKLHAKLAELQEKVDENRFEQELIYLLQKMDIAEEIDRLSGHINEAKNLLNSRMAIGRKLDFLLQEMNREANTIGSKANGFGLTINVVDIKVLLEQIREQIQNIE